MMRLPAWCLAWLAVLPLVTAEPVPENLLRDLSSDVFKTREDAEQGLRAWADRDPKTAEQLFAKQMETATDPELRSRCRSLLKYVVLMDYRKQGEGYVGIQMREEALPGGQKPAFGIRVTMVVPGTPADKAGMQAGDLILSFEGKGWDQADAMLRFGEEIRRHRPGEKVKMKLRRVAAGEMEVEVELARRPELLTENAGLLFGAIDLDQREIQKAQAESEEKYFQNWLAIRKRVQVQAQSPPQTPNSPAGAGGR